MSAEPTPDFPSLIRATCLLGTNLAADIDPGGAADLDAGRRAFDLHETGAVLRARIDGRRFLGLLGGGHVRQQEGHEGHKDERSHGFSLSRAAPKAKA